jgi:hypothetical protein
VRSTAARLLRPVKEPEPAPRLAASLRLTCENVPAGINRPSKAAQGCAVVR